MRRIVSFSAVLVLFFVLFSCSKDSTTPASTLVTTPDADAAEDNSSGGVYKGAFVGSSGVIKITLQKGKIEMIIALDGVSKTLTTTGLSQWKTGQVINNVSFVNGDWSAVLYVSADGTNPSVTITIPGHTDIGVALLKEKSTVLVKGYEGTYEGSDTGTFNFITRGTQILGVVRNSDGSIGGFEGTVSGNTINIPSAPATGTINGDIVSGTWGDPQDPNNHGTWKGKRTL